eukprot:TRINITY_DN91425_c0_g1_i1.p2 TRINITY_DN91425_c0_g1~~TRINITY_DN91425_c0_g1_i1.p2  ORF type:complete len:205 (-),score=49.59 TRINITY_DN91425_c0_g1_i1:171-785(-)
MAAQLPEWMTKRKRAKSVAEGATPKQARVVEEATQAAQRAVGGSGGKAGKKDVLAQLVAILGKLVLQSSQELREITGGSANLITSANHPLALAAGEAGEIYNEWITEQRKEHQGCKAMDLESDSDVDSEPKQTSEVVEKEGLSIPHVHVAVMALQAILVSKAQISDQGKAVLQGIQTCWDNDIKDKEEDQVARVTKIFRVKRPQ